MSPVEKVSRVLVGVDFDDASASALKMAGVLASTWDADITVFHSSTPDAPAYFTADQIETLEAEREQSRAGTAASSAPSPSSMCGVPFTWWSKKVRRVTLWYEWPPTSI